MIKKNHVNIRKIHLKSFFTKKHKEKTPKLFGQSLSDICRDNKLPDQIMVYTQHFYFALNAQHWWAWYYVMGLGTYFGCHTYGVEIIFDAGTDNWSGSFIY